MTTERIYHEESQHYEYPTRAYPTDKNAYRQAEYALRGMKELYGYQNIVRSEIKERRFSDGSGVIWADLDRVLPDSRANAW